jgi:GNAT superfamily N-acetyltransferase
MPESLTVVEIPLGDKRLKDFVKFAWRLYRGDPCWTPPLNGDLLGNRWLGLKGLLTPNHPYHRHAEVTHFMAYRGKQPVGRISAAINREFNDYHKTSLGFFGFFEVVNDYDVARTLLDKARKWITARGVAVMRGPGEYSNATHERQGVLIEGFQYPPTSDLTHNPPYYGEFLERYGFQKAKDYVAYYINRKMANINLLRRFSNKVSKGTNMQTRALVLKDLKAEVRLIVEIYNEAWAQNWGFLPISAEEGDAIADSLRIIVDPGLCRFAYIDGKPAAVMGLIPDPNYALRPRWHWYGDSDFIRIIRLLIIRRRIPRVRGMFFGIKPEYRNEVIAPIILNEIADYLLPRHYQESDASLLLEDNEAIIKIVSIFGGQYYKRWRIYDLPLK